MRPSVRRLSALGAALVLGAGGGAAAAVALDEPTTTTVIERGGSSDVAASRSVEALSVNEIYRRASKGIVEIKTTSPSSSGGPFGAPGDERSSSEGSGFVLNEDGDIVTNEHVVSNADSIQVTFAGGREANARVVGADASSDVAVVHVDVPSSELEPLTFGDSSQVEVGDAVVAIGSPYGLEKTATTGIISALDRSITSPSNYTISGALQTDAAINPGNSGGPLLDSVGRVIGVNAQIEGSSDGNTGVGFAIPSNTVKRVAEPLVAGEQVEHAYLGVSLGDAADGARVASVSNGSPAEDAGVEAGDVILAIGEKAVATADDAAGTINANGPGDEITLAIERGSERVTLDVTLGTRPTRGS